MLVTPDWLAGVPVVHFCGPLSPKPTQPPTHSSAHPSTGLADAAPQAGAQVAQLLRRTPRATHPLAQDSFKLLAGMLRACPGYAPPDGQLRYLLRWACTDLEEANGRQTVFSLLKVRAQPYHIALYLIINL